MANAGRKLVSMPSDSPSLSSSSASASTSASSSSSSPSQQRHPHPIRLSIRSITKPRGLHTTVPVAILPLLTVAVWFSFYRYHRMRWNVLADGLPHTSAIVLSPTMSPIKSEQGIRTAPLTHRDPYAGGIPPRGPRYVVYDSSYGSLNNQLNSLVSALTIAHRIGAVTVVGPAFGPSGSSTLMGQGNRTLYLAADFLDRKILQQKQKIVTWDEFINTDDGKKLTAPQFARYYFLREEERHVTIPRFYNRVLGLKPWAYKLNTRNWEFRNDGSSCAAIFGKAALMIDQCGSHQSCRFILLDNIFTNYYDCAQVDPYWRHLRKALIPHKHIRRTVDDFLGSVNRPIIAAHVRVVGAVDGKGDQFWNKLSGGIDSAIRALGHHDHVTIYVLGMKRTNERFHVINTVRYLREKWTEAYPSSSFTFLTCSDVPNCGESSQLTPWAMKLPDSQRRHLFQPQSLIEDSNCHYGTILLEEWISVMADAYVGRKESTFSQSVQLWRETVQFKSKATGISY